MLSKLTSVSIALAAVLICVYSCKKSNTSSQPQAYSPTCSGTKSYKNDVASIIQSNCVSCHSNFSTYSGVSASASSIRSAIANGSMPKNGSLTNGQKDNIMCWIDAGALNN